MRLLKGGIWSSDPFHEMKESLKSPWLQETIQNLQTLLAQMIGELALCSTYNEACSLLEGFWPRLLDAYPPKYSGLTLTNEGRVEIKCGIDEFNPTDPLHDFIARKYIQWQQENNRHYNQEELWALSDIHKVLIFSKDLLDQDKNRIVKFYICIPKFCLDSAPAAWDTYKNYAASDVSNLNTIVTYMVWWSADQIWAVFLDRLWELRNRELERRSILVDRHQLLNEKALRNTFDTCLEQGMWVYYARIHFENMNDIKKMIGTAWWDTIIKEIIIPGCMIHNNSQIYHLEWWDIIIPIFGYQIDLLSMVADYLIALHKQKFSVWDSMVWHLVPTATIIANDQSQYDSFSDFYRSSESLQYLASWGWYHDIMLDQLGLLKDINIIPEVSIPSRQTISEACFAVRDSLNRNIPLWFGSWMLQHWDSIPLEVFLGDGLPTSAEDYHLHTIATDDITK